MFVSVAPSIKLITIPCLFQSNGTGVGNPALCNVCIYKYYLVEEIRDKYNQLYDVLPPI
jgi:hypothetical protein